jgi:hypothetical protein
LALASSGWRYDFDPTSQDSKTMTITLNAAPTSWASDTNFASGPNSGTPTKVNPGAGYFAQGWVPGDTVPGQYANFLFNALTASLADIVSKVSNIAVDGAAGGTYTLSAPLIFNGTVRMGATGVFDIASSGQAQVSSGGFFNVLSGGKLDVISGGNVEFNDVDDLTIDDQIGAFRLTLTPQSVQADAGGTDPAWFPIFPGTPAFAGTTGGWYQSDVTFQPVIVFPISLPYGDDILTVVVSVNGSANGVGHAAKPTGGDLPTVSLVRVNTSGTATVLARRADQSADVTAYNAQHTITLATGALDAGAMPQTLDDDFMYYVVVTGETGGNAEADKFGVTGISGQTVMRGYRSFVTVA